MRRATAAAVPAAIALVAAGCGATRSAPTVVPLPTGALVSLVPAPAQVPADLVPLLKQSGPASLDRFASFSTDPSAERELLAAAGFSAGYVAEYADTQAGRTLIVTVARFATAAGAGRVLAQAVAGQRHDGSALVDAAPPVGTGAALFTQPLAGSATGQLVTLRFQVRRDLFLVAVSAPQPVNLSAVDRIGGELAAADHSG